VIGYYPRCCLLLCFDFGDTVIDLGDRAIDTATDPRRVGPTSDPVFDQATEVMVAMWEAQHPGWAWLQQQAQ